MWWGTSSSEPRPPRAALGRDHAGLLVAGPLRSLWVWFPFFKSVPKPREMLTRMRAQMFSSFLSPDSSEGDVSDIVPAVKTFLATQRVESGMCFCTARRGFPCALRPRDLKVSISWCFPKGGGICTLESRRDGFRWYLEEINCNSCFF